VPTTLVQGNVRKRVGEEMHSADEMHSAYQALKHSAHATLDSQEAVEKGKVPLSA